MGTNNHVPQLGTVGVTRATNQPIQPFQFKTVKDLYDAPEESVGYVVEGLLPSSGLSVLAGKPKAGKSTVARQLAVAVSKGTPFLGKKTEQGGVMYLALEEKQSEVAAHFKALGLSEADPVVTICGSIPRDQALAKLEAALKSLPETKLVIIDPLFKFVGGVRDGNDYVQVNNALEPLLTLARRYGVHIVIVHHMKKRETEDAMDGVLGSTAIAAAVDTHIALKVTATGDRTISSRQRYGSDLKESQLLWDADTRSLTLGMTCEAAEEQAKRATARRIEDDMTAYVAKHPGSTQEAILAAVTGKAEQKKRVLRKLIDDGTLLQSGSGVKGDAYTYTLKEIPVEQPSEPIEA